MGVEVQVKSSKIDELAKRLQSKAIYAGLPADSNPYPDGTSVVQVGVDHEFGSDSPRTYEGKNGSVTVSGIPERSFMRSTAKEKRSEWTKKTELHFKRILKSGGDIENALESVGQTMVADIQDKINTISTPPNSPQVIADKGSSNPLVDTGHMLQSITYDVRDS